MQGLRHDLKFAWRRCLKQPGLSALIVMTLALGIGINTAMFSVTWHLLLAPLPYDEGDRLVKLEQQEPGNGQFNTPWSLPTLADLRAQTTVFSAVLQYFQDSATLYSSRGPFQVDYSAVDGNFFTALGLQPASGRLFTADDDGPGATPVIVLGHRFWKEELGEDPDLIGSALEMNGFTYTVIGILPDIPPYPRSNDVWVPAASDFVMTNEHMVAERREAVISHVIGKLKEGVTLEQAREELTLFAGRMANSYPDIHTTQSAYTVFARPLQEDINGGATRTVLLLTGLAALVALIACSNVANITLAGIIQRNQELAVREAIGAPPLRIRWQLIIESMMICAVGGVVGLVVMSLSLGFITDFAALYTPMASEITVDGRVLWFCLALTLFVGLASALLASGQRRDLNQALKDGGDKATSSVRSRRTRDLLLTAQCALACIMLTATALVSMSLYRLATQPTGYETAGVVAVTTTMRGMNLETMWRERDMMVQVLRESSTLPGVSATGLTGTPLLQGPGFPPRPLLLEGAGADGTDRRIREAFTIVSAGFFDVMSIPLLEGRHFANSDDDKAPEVVIVNASFSERYFSEGNALGRRLSLNGGNTWASIVGVVGDIRARGINSPDEPMVYTHYAASPTQRINMYVKTSSDVHDTGNAVATIIRRLDPLQPIEAVVALDQVKNQWLAPMRLRTMVVAAFGLLALIVTFAGAVGVVSCNVSQRVREIGVHMAIGATPTRISRLFVLQGLNVCLLGVGLGLLLLLAAAPLLEPLLYETVARDTGIYLSSVALLMLAVLTAVYLPTRKARRMSPIVALHAE